MEVTPISFCKTGIRNVNLFFIVLDVFRKSTTTKEGAEVRTCKVADRTACINLSLWGDLGNYIQPGDICRVTKGYVSLYKGKPTLYVGKGGELVKTGEFCLALNESVDMSDPNINNQAVVPTNVAVMVSNPPVASQDIPASE